MQSAGPCHALHAHAHMQRIQHGHARPCACACRSSVMKHSTTLHEKDQHMQGIQQGRAKPCACAVPNAEASAEPCHALLARAHVQCVQQIHARAWLSCVSWGVCYGCTAVGVQLCAVQRRKRTRCRRGLAGVAGAAHITSENLHKKRTSRARRARTSRFRKCTIIVGYPNPT